MSHLSAQYGLMFLTYQQDSGSSQDGTTFNIAKEKIPNAPGTHHAKKLGFWNVLTE